MASKLSDIAQIMREEYLPALILQLVGKGHEGMLRDEGRAGFNYRRIGCVLPDIEIIPGWRRLERKTAEYQANIEYEAQRCDCCGVHPDECDYY